MKLEDRAIFARAVWDSFCAISGKERDMTCAEWHVLSGWMDQSIPLPVILRAFSEFSGTPRVLSAMEGPVERAYRYWYQAMGGMPKAGRVRL